MGVRQLVVVLLAGGVGWLLVRGLLGRRVPWIGIGVLLVPLVALGVTERQWSSAEHAFTGAARLIAPASSGVHCQRLGETFTSAGSELGSVWFDESGVPEPTATLAYATCQRLSAWWRASDREKAAAALDEVVAVHTLSHEAVHLTGDRSESSTECDAMQRDERTAHALGASAATARDLVVRYWRDVYPRMPAEYVSSDCREDGPLDRTPHDQHWP